MTQEELEKKAKDSYWDSDASGSMSSKDCYVLGYVAGAKEFEQKFIDTGKAYQDLINGWVIDYRELEKENEQLKEYNTDLKQSLDWANEREAEMVNRIEELKLDLERAKAIVEDLLKNSHESSRQNAEDFIKG